MKEIFEDIIARGEYRLSDILAKIKKYHIEGELTDEEKDELIVMARGNARKENEINVYEKLIELEMRVISCEKQQPAESGEAEEYIPGKWYYSGMKARFKDEVYTCIAPEGTPCVWSPEEYPTYWKKSL